MTMEHKGLLYITQAGLTSMTMKHKGLLYITQAGLTSMTMEHKGLLHNTNWSNIYDYEAEGSSV